VTPEIQSLPQCELKETINRAHYLCVNRYLSSEASVNVRLSNVREGPLSHARHVVSHKDVLLPGWYNPRLRLGNRGGSFRESGEINWLR
jgi:hypothetical protein